MEKLKELIERYKKAEVWFQETRTLDEIEKALVTLNKILHEIKCETAVLRKNGVEVNFKELLK